MFFQSSFSLKSTHPIEFQEISDSVQERVRHSECQQGLAVVSSHHTTAAIIVNEECESLQKDMETFLKNWIPSRRGYLHDRAPLDGRPNTHSHLMGLVLPQQVTLPVHEGKLQLGTWQKIFFVELDGPRPERKVIVTIVGEK